MGNKYQVQLIDGILKGDQNILKRFYQSNYNKIQFLVINNSGTEQDAEDVFQDAMVFVYQKLKSEITLYHNCTFETYFYGVCKNLWRNRLRKKLKTSCCGAIDVLHVDFVSSLEYKEKEQVYRKHFTKLNCKCQKILSLFFEGKTMSEIARLTNHTEGYIRKKKFECKNCLIKNIENDPLYFELHESMTNYQSPKRVG